MERFHWADYLVFALMLFLSASVGVYYRILDRKKRNAVNLQLGDRNMTLLPVTFSVVASFMSAISILGTTTEVYTNGGQYLILGLSYFIAFPLAAEVYMPIFYRLRLTSAHEFLELRFSPAVRSVTSFLFIFQMLLYISVVLYAPSLAFSQVSGFPMWISILSVGFVCTFYTSLGGIKAVMWTDFLQMLVVYAGLLATIVWGMIRIGGASVMWERAELAGRLNFFNFSPNPLERHTFWTLTIGGAFMCSSIYCSNQAQLQRYLSCKDERTARLALWINLPLTFAFLLLLVVGGLVTFAFYFDCDPLLAKKILRRDQVLPQLVLELFGQQPGLPGLFISCIFSAALSTVSTGINSLATVFYEDVLKTPVVAYRCCELSETQGSFYARIIALLFGLLTIGMAFACSLVTPTVLQIALSIFGLLGGPILAVFSLGILLPCVNAAGALAGLFVSLIINLWLGVGGIFNRGPSTALSMSTEGCLNGTAPNATSLVTSNPEPSIYHVSYLYYGLISCIVSLVVGLLVSICSGFNSKRPVASSLIHPCVLRLCARLPASLPAQVRQEARDSSACAPIVTPNENSASMVELLHSREIRKQTFEEAKG